MTRHLMPTLAALLLACGGATDAPPAADGATTADSGTAAPAVRFALAGDGVMLIDATSGSTRQIPFGTPDSTAIQAIAVVFGEPEERNANDECGIGPMEFVIFDGEGLLLAIHDRKFAGWAVRPPEGAALRTMSGIGVGSTREELEDVYAANIAPSTLGIEFMAGGLQGVLENNERKARIVAFWAGASCVAR
jgi:hypothetical protein